MIRNPIILADSILSPAALVENGHPVWNRLESHFAEVCRPFLPLDENAGPVLLACSGGCDSLALLGLLWRMIGKDRRERLEVVHVHHGLRGGEADADAAWVERSTRALGLRFHLRRLEVDSDSWSEAALRARRFEAIEDCLRSIGADTVFLGHHLNDLAEGMLLSLGRGAGLSGLVSPRPVQTLKDGLGNRYSRLHPLLSAPRELLESALESSGVGWREDSSNVSDIYARNRIRRKVIPSWQEAMPQDILRNVFNTRQLLEEVETGLEQLLDRIPGALDPGPCFDGRTLQGQPRVIWRRALFRWLNRMHPQLELRRHLADTLLDNWISGGRFECSQGGNRFVVAAQQLWSEAEGPSPGSARWNPVSLAVPGCLLFPDRSKLQVERISCRQAHELVSQGRMDCRREALLQAELECLDIGLWVPGDRMRPLGSPGLRKLQDIFTDRAIPPERRRSLPVVRDPANGSILWVPGVPSAHDFRIGPDCKSALKLTYAEHCTA